MEEITKIGRRELIHKISKKEGTTLKEAERIVNIMCGVLADCFIEKKRVELRGFGTFAVRVRTPRDNARDPRTGKILSVGTRYSIGFKPGKNIKALLNPDK